MIPIFAPNGDEAMTVLRKCRIPVMKIQVSLDIFKDIPNALKPSYHRDEDN